MKIYLLPVAAVISILFAIPLTAKPIQYRRHHNPKIVTAIIVSPKPHKKIVKPIQYSVTGGCRQYLPLVEKYDWNVNVAMAIMRAESTVGYIPCDKDAIGTASVDGVADYGLMQLHGVYILDPAQNIAYAYYHKYLTQGWGAWSTYNNKAYEKFL